MTSHRENPDGEENQRATKQTEREIFALQMQEKYDQAETDPDEMVVRDDAPNQP
jgi:hypothetical protein